MAREQNMDGAGSDDPQRQDYSKKSPTGEKPAKQIASENLSSRYARDTITGGDPIARMMNFYGKTPQAK